MDPGSFVWNEGKFFLHCERLLILLIYRNHLKLQHPVQVSNIAAQSTTPAWWCQSLSWTATRTPSSAATDPCAAGTTDSAPRPPETATPSADRGGGKPPPDDRTLQTSNLCTLKTRDKCLHLSKVQRLNYPECPCGEVSSVSVASKSIKLRRIWPTSQLRERQQIDLYVRSWWLDFTWSSFRSFVVNFVIYICVVHEFFQAEAPECFLIGARENRLPTFRCPRTKDRRVTSFQRSPPAVHLPLTKEKKRN